MLRKKRKKIYGRTALAIRDMMASLSEFPFRGALANTITLSSLGIRFVIFKNYYIFYRIDEAAGKVFILRVQYAKRDWPDFSSADFKF